MRDVSKGDVVSNYKQAAFRVLSSHDNPDISNVYHQVCLHNNCPIDDCNMPNGYRDGMNCQHVLSVKAIIDKILNCLNG